MHLESNDAWEALAGFVRESVERLVQQLLEAEASERLVRHRLAPPEEDGAPSCRSGHGRPRRLRTMAGDLRVRRPRLRGPAGGFRSEVLPTFLERARRSGRLQVEQYLAGIATGDFDRALAGLLGEPLPLPESATARLRRWWLKDQKEWRCASLDRIEPRYVWIDRFSVAPAPPPAVRTPLIVAIASLAEGESRVLAVEPSSQSASAVLRRLRERGLADGRLVVGGGELSPDGGAGPWSCGRDGGAGVIPRGLRASNGGAGPCPGGPGGGAGPPRQGLRPSNRTRAPR